MKICTITCSNADNHGARLQTYALARHLQLRGHQVEVIDYRPGYMRFGLRQWYNPGFDIKQIVKLVVQWRYRRDMIERHRQFECFSDRRIPLTSTIYDDCDSLRLDPPVADAYIVGSDQVWNTNFANGRDRAFYLDFGSPDTLRLSYAASFAIPALPADETQTVKSRLQRLDRISVREDSAVGILNGLGLDGDVVVDPVFLLSKDRWCSEMSITDTDRGDYVLVYDFERSAAVRQVAQRLAKACGLRVCSVSPYRSGYADKDFIACAPEQFVRLVAGAHTVVSNSFHGSAFAMVFEKDFLVVDRADGLNVRMHDLLMRYGLGNRLVQPDAPETSLTTPIDYAAITPALGKHIDSSRQWLDRALNK